MKSLILIPSYLWKNTLKRWLENPISPISKILVPSLLATLAILVLVLFTEAESQLRAQLKEGDSYNVYIMDRVIKQKNSTTAELSIIEEAMFRAKYPGTKMTFIRQTFATVKWKDERPLPVIVYTDSLPSLNKLHPDLGTPSVWFLTNQPDKLEAKEILQSGESSFFAIPHLMPEIIQKNIRSLHVVALPIEMAKPLLADGFIVHIIAEFDSIADVRSFVKETDAYFDAQNRNIRSFSALEILENIGKLNVLQNYIRIGIISSCGLILALILGTIAWLEYREEAYINALLQSFGTPRLILLTHAFLENLLLVSCGVMVAMSSWRKLYSYFQKQATGLELSPPETLTLPHYDAAIIFLAAFLGVIAAMMPIAKALRKPAGLILQ